jgi:hypothetical protein
MRGKAVPLALGVCGVVLIAWLAASWWSVARELARTAAEPRPPVPEPAQAEPEREPEPVPPVIDPVVHGEPGSPVRRITQANPVLAIYRRGSQIPRPPGLILAAWPDGQLVWSEDHVWGDPPYRTGRIDPKAVADLLARFDRDGLFADKKLNESHTHIHFPYLTILIRSGSRQVRMVSCHELFEDERRLVDDGLGVRSLSGRRRPEVLREAKADYLFYRFVWSQTKGKLIDLIPAEGTPTDGRPFYKAGEVYWRDPPVPASDEFAFRAMSVQLSPDGRLPDALRPGDRVDLFVGVRVGGDRATSEPVAEGRLVLAVNAADRALSVAVTPAQVEAIRVAEYRGDLRAVRAGGAE